MGCTSGNHSPRSMTFQGVSKIMGQQDTGVKIGMPGKSQQRTFHLNCYYLQCERKASYVLLFVCQAKWIGLQQLPPLHTQLCLCPLHLMNQVKEKPLLQLCLHHLWKPKRKLKR